MYDRHEKASDKSLRTMTRQLTVAAQSLMMTYETLSLQKDTLTKQVEVYEKALNLEKQNRQQECLQQLMCWKRKSVVKC